MVDDKHDAILEMIKKVEGLDLDKITKVYRGDKDARYGYDVPVPFAEPQLMYFDIPMKKNPELCYTFMNIYESVYDDKGNEHVGFYIIEPDGEEHLCEVS